MKIIRTILLFVVVLLGLSTVAFAADNVKIKVNGVGLSNAQAILKDGTTLLPVRSVGNALGGDIIWDAATKTVVVTKDDTRVVMPVGEKYIIVDNDIVSISMPAQVINGRTYVPLRVLGDALDCDVKWVNATKTVEITNKKASENRDLFADSKDDVPYFLSDGVYLTVGETVPVPVVGGNWVHWSNDNIKAEWGFYNDQEVVFITGRDKGTTSLKLYESESRKGRIEGDYTEIKVHVVNSNHKGYIKQKEERIISGFDMSANQDKLIMQEQKLKADLGLKLENLYDVNYICEDGVLIVPLESKKDLTGLFNVITEKNADLDVVLDEYNGTPAFFIKGNKLANTNIVVKYTHIDDVWEFYHYQKDTKPDLFEEREVIRESSQIPGAAPSAMWEFRVNVVSQHNSNYKNQEAERIANGISYDLYLLGLA